MRRHRPGNLPVAKPKYPSDGVSNWPAALYRHPMTTAYMRTIVPQRAVLDAAIVPKGDGIVAPAEAAVKFWCRYMFEQEVKYRAAFSVR